MKLETRSSIILLLATILAASGWVFSKQAITALPAFGFIGLRFFCAGLILFPFCILKISKMNIVEIAKAMGVGLLLACTLISWIYAISMSASLGEGAFITSLSMLFVPLIAWLLFKEAPPRIFWLSLPIAIIGLAILSLSGASWQFSPSQIWFLVSALSLAIHFNLNNRRAQKVPAIALTCIQLFVVGVIAGSFSLAFETFPSQVENEIWIWFALSVFVATSLRYLMQTIGQKGISSSNAALIMILEPIWTVVFSVIFYQEAMPMNKLIGCIFILFSLLIYRLSPTLLKRYILK